MYRLAIWRTCVSGEIPPASHPSIDQTLISTAAIIEGIASRPYRQEWHRACRARTTRCNRRPWVRHHQGSAAPGASHCTASCEANRAIRCPDRHPRLSLLLAGSIHCCHCCVVVAVTSRESYLLRRGCILERERGSESVNARSSRRMVSCELRTWHGSQRHANAGPSQSASTAPRRSGI